MEAEKGVSTIEPGERGQTTLVIVTKRIIVAAVGEATLNFLITGVTFREIILSSLEASMQILSVMAILNGLRQLTSICP